MASRPPLANTCKVEIGWSLSGGSKANNIFYIQTGTPVTSVSGLSAIASALDSSLTATGNNWVSPLGTSAALVSWTVIDNTGATDNFFVSNVSHSGSGGTSIVPLNCAMGASWAIAARYRGGKPRWYIPGILTTHLSGTNINQFTSTFITAMQTPLNSWLAAVNANVSAGTALTVGTISYQTGKAPRPTPLFRPFVSCTVHPRVDTQRRRLGKEVGVL